MSSVTFLLCDIEGSMQGWERASKPVSAALRRYDELLRAVVQRHGGEVFRADEVGFASAFGDAADAVAAAIDAQRAVAAARWPPQLGPLRMRVALHTGSAIAREGRYDGPLLARAVRLLAVGFGGQILASSATAARLRADVDGVSLRDLGSVRLKDLGDSETVFQIVAGGLQSEFPAPQSLDARPNNLPSQMSSFLGRRDELARLQALLREQRLVTVTGPGGMGKTRLAMQAAADAIGEFDGGCWFVRLLEAGDPSYAATAIADALRVRGNPEDPIERRLVARLAEKPTLLLLDDAEGAAGAVAGFLVRLLHACPQLHVLVTSRTPLRIEGEAIVSIGPLDASEQLFYERARAVRPDIALTDTAAGAVREICSKLHGVPLAIELAAAYVATAASRRAAAEPVARLGENLPARADRRQALQGTLDWVYRWLTPRERQAFVRLAVFEGSFAQEAAERIAGETRPAARAKPALEALVDRALVTRFTLHGTARYRMHHDVREFALERLRDLQGTVAAERRFVEYYRDLAERLGRLERDNEAAALEQIFAESKNVGAALRIALQERLDVDAGRAIVLSLWHAWSEAGRAAEGRHWIDRALEGPGLSADVRADLLYAMAGMAQRVGDVASLAALGKLLVESFERRGDPVRLGKAVHLLGNARYYANEMDEAEELYRRALALHRQAGNRDAEAVALMNLGAIAAEHRRDYAAAESLYRESLEIYQEHGISVNLGLVMGNLGELAALRKDYRAALGYARNAINVFAGLGNRTLVAFQYIASAEHRIGLGEYAAAAGALARAVPELHDQPNHRYRAYYFEVAMRLAVEIGALELAAQILGFVERYRSAHRLVRDSSETTAFDAAVERLSKALPAKELAEDRRIGDECDDASSLEERIGRLAPAANFD